MPGAPELEILLTVGAVYVAMITAMLQTVPSLSQAYSFLVRPVRHLRYFTIGFAAKILSEVVLTYAPRLAVEFRLDPLHLSVNSDLSFREGTDILFGIGLVTLLWLTRRPLLELEKAARKFTKK